jgi:predicted DNA-binding transcriptional regulator
MYNGNETENEPVDEEEYELLDFTSRVYKLVVEHGKGGVLQSELWKKLNLTSRDGSRLAIRLEKRGMIKREKVLDGGRWTYKLSPLRLPARIRSIEQAPCVTCPNEIKCAPNGVITPFSCLYIAEWVTREYLKTQNIPLTQEAIYSRIFAQKM